MNVLAATWWLAVRTEDRGDGGEDHEVVERQIACQFMQEPAAVHLGGEDGIEAGPVETGQGRVVQQAGQMEDARQRHGRGQQMRAERLGQGGPVRHVHLQEADIASCGGDLFHRGRAGGTGLRQAASQQPYLSAPRQPGWAASARPRSLRPPVTR